MEPIDIARLALKGETETVLGALNDPSPSVRRAVVLSLERLDVTDEQIRASVTTALNDAEPSVRQSALFLLGRPALAHITATLVAQVVDVLTGDSEPHCRDAAAFALGEAHQGAPQLADALAKESVPMVREAILGALGSLGDPTTLDAVLAAAAGPKPPVRRRALVALSGFEDPQAHDAIVAGLEDRDRSVREIAAWLLRDDAAMHEAE